MNPKLVSYRGAVVILSASSEGRGYHSLSGETGASLYKIPDENIIFSTFGKRTIMFYSPNVTQADMRHFYPKSVIFEKDFSKIIHHLEQLLGKNIKAGIIPTSIQLPKKGD